MLHAIEARPADRGAPAAHLRAAARGRARHGGGACARFGTSQVTIRADLSTLESAGALTRTHGGALLRAGRRPAARRQAAAASRREGAHRPGRRGADPRRRNHHPGLRHHHRRDRTRTFATLELKSINVITNALNIAALLMDVPSRAADHAGRHPAPGIQLALRSHGRGGARNLQADRLYLGADGLDPEIGRHDAAPGRRPS